MSLSDLFTGSSGNLSAHTSDSGHSWTAQSASVSPTSRPINLSGAGQIYCTASSVVGVYTSSWVPAGIPIDMTFSIAQASASGYAGIVFCYSGANIDAATYYYVRFNGPSTQAVEFCKVVGGVGGTPVTYAASPGSVSVSLRRVASNNEITVTVGGVAQTTIVDSSSPLSAGSVGVWFYGSGSSGADEQLDSITAADVVVSGATAFTLTGPSAGPAGAASAVFTVTPTGGNETGTFTPNAISGVSFSPATLTWSGDAAAKTFTVTKSVAGGPVNINGTFSNSLTVPANVPYTAKATTVRSLVVDGAMAGDTMHYAIKNDDGTYFSDETGTAVADQGGGVFSVPATIPIDQTGIVQWHDVTSSKYTGESLYVAPTVITGVVEG